MQDRPPRCNGSGGIEQFTQTEGYDMRFRSETDQDRPPLIEAGARAAAIRSTAAVLAMPCPTASRSPRMVARWGSFLQHPAVVTR